jgi:hypothetical protein
MRVAILVTVMIDTVTREALKIKLKSARARLQRRCRRVHITHDMIAARAVCSRTMVVHWFAARIQGRGLVGHRVGLVVLELLAERNGRAA